MINRLTYKRAYGNIKRSMKLRSTTPASRPISARVTLVIISVFLLISIPIGIVNNASADQYDDQIRALQKDIAVYEAEGKRLNNEAVTLQAALSQLANQKAVIQTQVDISQAKYDQLTAQIIDTEKQIKDNQDALGKTLADLYVDGKISPLEMLASSSNIGDYLDKQAYRSSVRDELTSTISKINKLKKTLVAKKVEIEKVLTEQKAQRDQLAQKENEQQGLLQKTQGQEAGYQQLIGDSQAAISAARAEQAAIRASINQSGGGAVIDGGLLGEYPWNYSNCPMGGYIGGRWVDFASTLGSDGNGMDGGADSKGSDGYGCRQCVSYVAWRIAKETNFYPYWGNAKDFTANAQARYGVGDGQPHPGSIAVMSGGTYGHVAWVETEPYIKNGRNVIQVSQYNYDYGAGYGMYSLMELSVDAFDYYVHIK